MTTPPQFVLWPKMQVPNHDIQGWRLK